MLLGSRLHHLQKGQPTTDRVNFWLDMVPVIEQRIEKVIIASIGGLPVRNPWGGRTMRTWDVKLRNSTIEGNYLIKTLLFARAGEWIRKSVREDEIDVIHLIDNFGPVQITLSRIHVPKTTFQLHYDPRYPFYDQSLRMSLRPFDAVFAGSQRLARRLQGLRIGSRVVTNPWGVSSESLKKGLIGQSHTRCQFGLENSKIVLWTGFISTVAGRKEFHFSLRIAKNLVKELPDVSVVFAFKRGLLTDELKRFQENKIKFVELRSRTEFLSLASVSTLLLSPCLNSSSIIGPVLSWLECMALGIPVVTTKVSGVEEFIVDKYNGVIISDANHAAQALPSLLRSTSELERLASGAIETIRKRFDLSKVAVDYVNAWLSMNRSQKESRRS
jgi:glycosyltransferase involved in cell wall biosynthesis